MSTTELVSAIHNTQITERSNRNRQNEKQANRNPYCVCVIYDDCMNGMAQVTIKHVGN